MENQPEFCIKNGLRLKQDVLTQMTRTIKTMVDVELNCVMSGKNIGLLENGLMRMDIKKT